jgi:RHS repeat-associated protein
MKIFKSKIMKFFSCFLSVALLLDQLVMQELCHAEDIADMVKEHGPCSCSSSSSSSNPLFSAMTTADASGEEPSSPAAPTMNIFNVVQSFRGDPFSGAAVSSIPFTVPPSRMKSGMDISLVYNSSSNNGICGVGWDLSLPFIQRQTKNGVPNYGPDDIFGLGQGGSFKEFIKISSSEYRFKIEEAFWKIEFNGAYWICRDKEGTVFRFGYNADGKEDGRSGVFKWCLDRITDIHGNYCAITYMKDRGRVYFSQIKYTGNDSTGEIPRTEVNFAWQDRLDVYCSYISGAKISTAKRLSSIEAKQSSVLVRRYNFSYIQSVYTKRSLIESVTLTGSDGNSTLPIAKFNYSGQEAGSAGWSGDDSRWHAPNGGFIDGAGQYNGRQLIDLNGDSRPDFVVARHNDADPYPWLMTTHLNSSNGFSAAGNWKPIPKGYFIYHYWDDGRRVLDLTRDGKPEEIAASLWDPYRSPSDPDDPGRFKTAYRHTGQDWTLDTAWNLPDDNYFVYGNRVDGGCRFGDLNGDGYADLMISRKEVRWNNRSLDAAAAINACYINTGSGWKRDTKWDLPDGAFVNQANNFQSKDEGRRLVDINGDGLSDLLIAQAGYKASYLNTGAGWARDDTWNLPDGDFVDTEGRDQGRWLSDVNGDGLTDLLIAKDTYKAAYINTGAGWMRDDVWNSPLFFSDSNSGDQGVVLSDLNSDGLTDVMSAKGTDSKAFLNKLGSPDLLTGVDNGIGAKTQISYKSSAYYNNTGVDSIQDLPFVIQTVSQVTADDGIGNKYTTRYDYYGGMFDGPAREFRGFGHVWVYDTDNNNVETIFYQDEYRNSRPYYEKYFDSSGKLCQQKLYNWKIKDLASGAKFVYLEDLNSYIYGASQADYKQVKVFNVYDDYGNPTEIINYGDVNDANDDRSVATEYHYNINSWLLSLPKHTAVKNNLKNIASEKWFYYDNNVNIDTLPQKGLLTKEEAWLNTSQKRIAAIYGYDKYGNLVSTTNALSRAVTVTYDSVYHQFPVKTVNPLGHSITSTYDPGTGQALTSTDSNGQTSRNIYDAFGRVSGVYGPNDDANHPGIWYEYDLSAPPVKITTSIREEHNTNIAGKIRKSFRFYDGLGRLIQTKTEAEDISKMIISDVVVFNTRGEVKDKYLSYFADYSTGYTPPDYSKPKASFQYDSLGRLIKTTSVNENGQNISGVIDYYLWTRTMTDANGHKIKNYYDGHGQLIKVEEFNGSAIYATAYYYDTLGNLTKTIDAQGNASIITYDSLGRKISMADPDMGTWAYLYDDLGNLIKQTDAKGQALDFQYDALNRLVTKKSGGVTLANYIYDEAGKSNCIGRLSKVIDQNSATEFFYDNLGREIGSTKTIDADSYTVERTYDALGRLISLKYPDGEIVNYTYNRAGGIEKVIGNKTYVSNINYTASGQVNLISYGNNTHTDYTYNPFTLRLESLKSNDGALQDLQYQFDNVGNVLKITDSRYTSTQAFTYDSLDRLISATGQSYGAKAYKYDSIGNMTEKEGVTFAYGAGPAGPHALTSGSNNLTAVYDANGNMITKNTKHFSYDAENRLTKIDTDEVAQDPGISTFNLTLKPGWNFMSLPFIPTDGKISSIFSKLTFGTDYDQISRYNPAKNDFDNYNNNIQYNQFDTIEYGKGYFVYSPGSNNVTLTVTGKQPVTSQALQLKSGWNLIGAPLTKDYIASQALNNLKQGVDYDRIVRYNSVTQLFENLSAADLLKPGQSYYIHCLKDTTWAIPLDPLLKGGMEFAYDGDGGRIKKASLSGTTVYVGSLYEIDSDGKIRKHIFSGANRIATLSLRGGSGATDEAISFYHTDHLGSSNVITDSTGVQIQYCEYTPYGSTQVNTGTDVTKYKFTGKELDTSGIYFYGARYYDSDIGRFISADPTIQRPYDPQDLNRYTYCRNNPINLIDPSGLGWFSKIWDNIGNFFGDLWKDIKAPVTSFAIAFVASGFNPIAGLAAAVSTAVLDTGEGRDLIRRVGQEFFDDVLGMRPKAAYIWSSIGVHVVTTLAFETAFANIVADPVSADKFDPSKHAIEGRTPQGKMYGPSPDKGRFAENELSAIVDSSGKQVGTLGVDRVRAFGLDKGLRGLAVNHTGVNMVGYTGKTINPFTYGFWGTCHQATNVGILNSGYSSTLMTMGKGGWSVGATTIIYGNYGGGLFHSVYAGINAYQGYE